MKGELAAVASGTWTLGPSVTFPPPIPVSRPIESSNPPASDSGGGESRAGCTPLPRLDLMVCVCVSVYSLSGASVVGGLVSGEDLTAADPFLEGAEFADDRADPASVAAAHKPGDSGPSVEPGSPRSAKVPASTGDALGPSSSQSVWPRV
jgi:hypothetical protein